MGDDKNKKTTATSRKPVAEVKCFDGIPMDSSITCPPTTPSAMLGVPGGHDANSIVIGKASQAIPNRNALVVGRQVASCDIKITHKSLSRQHALLYYHAARLYIFDLKTKAGTFVNHKKIIPGVPVELSDGDTIGFGKYKQHLTVRWNQGKSSQASEESNSGSANGVEVEASGTRGDEIGEKDDGNGDTNAIGDIHSSPNNAGEDVGTGTELHPSLEGLTGRERRKAEIAAMMASLDETPTYTKYAPCKSTSDPNDRQSQTASVSNGEQEALPNNSNNNNKKNLRALEKYHLPLTESTDMAVFETSNTSSAVMDPTGSRFAIGSTDSSLKLYDFAGINPIDPTPFRNLIVEDGYPIRSMTYSSDGASILIGTGSAQPRVFSRDGEEIIQFVRGDVYVRDPSKTIGHTAMVTCVGWHPLEKSIVFTTSRDGSLRSWNVDKGKLSFGMLNCSDVVVIKHLRTGRKTIPSCLAVTPSALAIGTECGSLQIYKYPFVSKLRPQESFQVSAPEDGGNDGNPILSLVYSVDASKLAVRTKKELTVWNTAKRISSSSTPLVKYENVPLHDDDVGADSSTPTMAFSPDGKTICVATNSKGETSTSYRSSLDVFALPKPSKPVDRKKHLLPIFSLPIGAGNPSLGPILSLFWHHKLNQILLTTLKGFQIVYSVDWSKKGILLTSGRRKKRSNAGEQSLQELYASRAPPPGINIRQDEIINPNSLPLFSNDKQRPKSKKQRTEEEHRESIAKHIPQQPAKGVFSTGVNMFTQMIMDDRSSSQKKIAGMDPREALAQYSEGKSFIGKAYEGNVERILTEKTMEQEQEEMENKN